MERERKKCRQPETDGEKYTESHGEMLRERQDLPTGRHKGNETGRQPDRPDRGGSEERIPGIKRER